MSSTMATVPEPAKVARTVNFTCGCMAVNHNKGDLEGKDWQVIPCYDHADQREDIKREADRLWWAYQFIPNNIKYLPSPN